LPALHQLGTPQDDRDPPVRPRPGHQGRLRDRRRARPRQAGGGRARRPGRHDPGGHQRRREQQGQERQRPRASDGPVHRQVHHLGGPRVDQRGERRPHRPQRRPDGGRRQAGRRVRCGRRAPEQPRGPISGRLASLHSRPARTPRAVSRGFRQAGGVYRRRLRARVGYPEGHRTWCHSRWCGQAVPVLSRVRPAGRGASLTDPQRRARNLNEALRYHQSQAGNSCNGEHSRCRALGGFGGPSQAKEALGKATVEALMCWLVDHCWSFSIDNGFHGTRV
ncbi:hypothetical protein CTA2_1856, partial [Colletotrichum tanaceti]